MFGLDEVVMEMGIYGRRCVITYKVREEGGYDRGRAPPPGGSEGWDTRG